MYENRDYQYLDLHALDAAEIRPVDGTPEEVLEGGLTDIIQLAGSGGMTDDVVDRVLARIVADRKARRSPRLTVLRGGEQ